MGLYETGFETLKIRVKRGTCRENVHVLNSVCHRAKPCESRGMQFNTKYDKTHRQYHDLHIRVSYRGGGFPGISPQHFDNYDVIICKTRFNGSQVCKGYSAHDSQVSSVYFNT